MRSTAPALIYEEGDLIKRSLRDVYDTDIAQVLVEGEAGFQGASEFMRQLVPHQADKVQLYDEPIPLFHRYQVENQFDAMHSPVVQLRSGGYIVINPTEALVAIDVNSGRSTKERNIEETALRTNIEAAEEISRQVRLRDLAGLIVIDFIDMEENRHQRQVEHKVKDTMRNDRARIQIGRISAFGLLEMSRQRLRPSLLEHSTEVCPHCAGTGRIRSIESAALHALRAIEEEGVRRRANEIAVSVPPNVALYLLNSKRRTLSEIEQRYGFTVGIEADEEMHAADCEIERVRSRRDDHQRPAQELARASYDEVQGEAGEGPAENETAEDDAEGSSNERLTGERGEEDADGRGRRRRRRRRRGTRREGDERVDGEGEREHAYAGENGAEPAHQVNGDASSSEGDEPAGEGDGAQASEGNGRSQDGENGDRPRRRGRRGGRRRRREDGDERGPREHAPRESWDQASAEQASESGAAPAPMEGMPVDQLPGEHMPIERPPYEPSPAVNVEAVPAPAPAPIVAPPPEPVFAAAPQPPAPAPEPPPPAVPSISADTPPEKPKRGWWRR
jgi:ribonuclease E